MKRFEKIWGSPPETTPEVITLPLRPSVWGENVFADRKDAEFLFHYHSTGVVAFIESGHIGFRSETFSSICHPKTALYIPPHSPHITHNLAPQMNGWFISLPPRLCENLPQGVVQLNDVDLLAHLGKRIAFAGLQSKLLNSYVDTFINELSLKDPTPPRTIRLPQSPQLISIAEKLMESPDDMRNIDYWAKAAGMSRRSFTRAFNRETGLPFSTWRRRLKIQKAIRDLSAGMSVGDISFALGYQNPSAFIIAFRSEFGVSPMEYLKSKIRNP